MAGRSDTPPEITSAQGIAAFHPDRAQADLLVAPTVAAEFNTLGLDLIPVACVSLSDVSFEFDSSFILPEAGKVLSKLPALREARKDKAGQLPPLSAFGHADPTGTDEYNKQLSGRRAKAVYGLITHKTPIWQNLYDQPFGGDNWKTKNVLTTMSNATGLSEDAGFASLAGAYMKALCPVALNAGDFLAQGADSKGKGDYQGCSDFNPLLLLSKTDQQKLPKEERDARNRSNRRVVVYLFRPGTIITAGLWPCPRTNETSAGCHKRFFSDGDSRRAPGSSQREHAVLQGTPNDTFACRFYARIGGASPCEKPVTSRPLSIRLFDPFTVRISKAPYRITVAGEVFETEADPDGFVHLQVAGIPEDCLVEWGRDDDQPNAYLFSRKIYLQMEELEEDEEVARRLHNLGYSGDDPLTDKVKRFQTDYGFAPTGQTADVKSTLRQWHDDPAEVEERPEATRPGA